MEAPQIILGTADGVHALRPRSGRPPSGPRRLPSGPVPATHALAGHAVRSVVRDGGRLWAILDARAIWRKERGGRWREVFTSDRLALHCLLPTPIGLLVGTSEAHLCRLEDGPDGTRVATIPSFELVAGRATWSTPWGAPADVRSLSRAADGTIYVNVHVGGVARSRDGGRSWRPTMDVAADAHQVLAHPSAPGLVAAATAVGLAWSPDGGETWSFRTEGLHATYQRALAFTRDYLLVSVADDEGGARAALYRAPAAAGTPLAPCRDGLPRWFGNHVNTGCLAAEGEFVALGTADGNVFASLDQGTHFELLAQGLPAIKALALA